MTLQYIVDRAESIEFDRRQIASQTISRSQRIKTAARVSAQPWRWIVTPPGNISWDASRGIIELIDKNDRITETEINLNHINFITRYQGDLNSTQLAALTIDSTTTSTMTIDTLPSIGDVISSRSIYILARSFEPATSVTYNRALSTTRADFLISNSDFDANFYNFMVGDTLSTTTYLVSNQTISSITRNYITLAGVGYTRVILSQNPDASSSAAITTSGSDVLIHTTSSQVVTTSTVIFKAGDFIQPANSRYPYTVVNDVLRGSGSSVTLNLNRSIITSENVTLTDQTLKVGNSCSWRMVVVGLPTYKIVGRNRLEYQGTFELIEKII